MTESNEVSTHLYDSVNTTPPDNHTPTVEEIILNRKRLDLPPEKIIKTSPSKKQRPSTSNSSIFSGFKVQYDISHRRSKKKKDKDKDKETMVELPKDVEPTVVNMNPPKEKDFWVSKQRKAAQRLIDELIIYLENADKEKVKFNDPLDQKTYKLQKSIKIFQNTLSKFTDEANEDSKERGEVLSKISGYYKSLANEIPQLKEHYKALMDEAMKRYNEALERKKKLEAERDASQAVIDKQNRTMEGLKQQMNEFRSKCTNAENQLRDITNDKSGMIRSSHTNQEKLQEINLQIEEKNKQKKKVNDLIETLTKDISRKTEELKQATRELKDVKDELDTLHDQNKGFQAIINDRTKLLAKLIETPLRDADRSDMHDIAIEVNTVPRKKDKKKSAAANATSISGQDEFKQIKSDMQLVKKEMAADKGQENIITENNIEINSYEDLMKVRETILKNNNIFDYSVKSITKANAGDFILEGATLDQSRLFAHWMMIRIMRNACAWQVRAQAQVQTDEVESLLQEEPEIDLTTPEEKKDQEIRLAPKMLQPFMKKSRFLSLLTSDESHREPKNILWLIHAIRSIFDEKTVDDRTQIRNNDEIMPLPEYLLKWAFRQYGRDDLIQKGCWDIFITSHHHMQKYLEITLFVRFLDEEWTTEQLTFFLKCRLWILERCVSIPVQHIELDEYLTETYLTKAQVFMFFRDFFPDTDEELRTDIAIRACDTADHERNTSRDASCIPMNRVLELAIGEQMDGRVRRVRRMLAFYRPIPRMTLKRFDTFLRQMITNIDPNMVDSLYRSSLVPNTIRSDIDQTDFVEMYYKWETIVPKNFEGTKITCDDFAEYSTVYNIVLNRLKQMQVFIQRMLDALERKNDLEEVRVAINEIRHQSFQMLEAKLAFDGILFYQNYHKLLQVILSACYKLNLPDTETYTKQILDFQNVLFSKHKQVVEQLEANTLDHLDDN